jgi:hypothetical protein
MQLTGTFQITDWQESVEKSFDEGGKLTSAKVCQTYSGDITGKSGITYQMNYEPNGNASFIGLEFIVGNITGKFCKLTIKHDGRFENGLAKSEFSILSSCTHKELVGVKGIFESVEGGKANFAIG